MLNNGRRVLVFLLALTLPLSLPLASEAERKADAGTQASLFSGVRLTVQLPSDEYRELKAIAAEAFKTLSPATQKWFAAAAEENASKQSAGGSFDSASAAKALVGRFSSGQITDHLAEIIVAIFALQSAAVREGQEARKLARHLSELELDPRAGKLNAQNQSLEQQRKEARERYDRAMEAADMEMWSGVMGGLCAIYNSGIGSLVNSRQPPAKVEDKSLRQAVLRKLRAQLVKLRTSGL